ncbi:Uncharacterised protein [Vibrio cholerae]|uniref:Uncharacterized protein n=1 Tax=Vibrio cholerae TaxID=666 RepID=A0A655ZGX6_VIBCL|nr:Uncharacterised protein [Vibrio cholerae]
MRFERVAAAITAQEHRLLVALTTGMSQVIIARFVVQALAIHIMTLGVADPAFFRQHDGDRFTWHQITLGQRFGFFAFDQW